MLVTERWPKTIIECGSGVSTMWLAHTIARCGYDGRIISLEHELKYRDKTMEQLKQHGLGHIAEVRHSPLTEVTIEGSPWQWYDLSVLDDVPTCDLLFVDGPPRTTGPLARYPSVALLADRLATDAVVVLDDVDRSDEQQILRRWSELIAWREVYAVPGAHSAAVLYR